MTIWLATVAFLLSLLTGGARAASADFPPFGDVVRADVALFKRDTAPAAVAGVHHLQKKGVEASYHLVAAGKVIIGTYLPVADLDDCARQCCGQGGQASFSYTLFYDGTPRCACSSRTAEQLEPELGVIGNVFWNLPDGSRGPLLTVGDTYNLDTCQRPCSGLQTLTSSSGTITDHTYVGNYFPNSDCQWLIEPVGVSATAIVRLTFSRFDTELDWDFVTVYDGTTTAATQLFRGSGSVLPSPVIVSSGSSLLVTFTSDGNTQRAGFEATWVTEVVTTGTTGTTSTGTTSTGTTGTTSTGTTSTGTTGTTSTGTTSTGTTGTTSTGTTSTGTTGTTRSSLVTKQQTLYTKYCFQSSTVNGWVEDYSTDSSGPFPAVPTAPYVHGVSPLDFSLNARDRTFVKTTIAAGQASTKLSCVRFTGVTFPPDAAVTGIQVVTSRNATADGLKDVSMHLIIPGTADVLSERFPAGSGLRGQTWPTKETNIRVGGAGDLWNVPFSLFSPAILNSMQFGVAFVTQNFNSKGKTIDAFVNEIDLIITYTTADLSGASILDDGSDDANVPTAAAATGSTALSVSVAVGVAVGVALLAAATVVLVYNRRRDRVAMDNKGPIDSFALDILADNQAAPATEAHANVFFKDDAE